MNFWAKIWVCIIFKHRREVSEEDLSVRLHQPQGTAWHLWYPFRPCLQTVVDQAWLEQQKQWITSQSVPEFSSQAMSGQQQRSLSCFRADFFRTGIIVDIFQREGTKCWSMERGVKERHWADQHKISKFCHRIDQGSNTYQYSHESLSTTCSQLLPLFQCFFQATKNCNRSAEKSAFQT